MSFEKPGGVRVIFQLGDVGVSLTTQKKRLAYLCALLFLEKLNLWSTPPKHVVAVCFEWLQSELLAAARIRLYVE